MRIGYPLECFQVRQHERYQSQPSPGRLAVCRQINLAMATSEIAKTSQRKTRPAEPVMTYTRSMSHERRPVKGGTDGERHSQTAPPSAAKARATSRRINRRDCVSSECKCCGFIVRIGGTAHLLAPQNSLQHRQATRRFSFPSMLGRGITMPLFKGLYAFIVKPRQIVRCPNVSSRHHTRIFIKGCDTHNYMCLRRALRD